MSDWTLRCENCGMTYEHQEAWQVEGEATFHSCTWTGEPRPAHMQERIERFQKDKYTAPPERANGTETT